MNERMFRIEELLEYDIEKIDFGGDFHEPPLRVRPPPMRIRVPTHNRAATTMPTTPARAICDDAWRETPALGCVGVSVASAAPDVELGEARLDELVLNVTVGVVKEEAEPVGKYEDVVFALNDVKLFVTVEVATLLIVT